ncbi:protein kinase domain-containing protein [Aporhodopirellula aestuarii]|uniref:Protein kinase n=1 Tax=Aporhodopirellula aestuarii TaxID=2950107 RepID=A0ABT0U6M3_9BACT|nr:protein kinase [Aporhodopirellula aestuarii]MCM2372324.1 protein kinase [Aporhodopirellula aestuarii]
MAKSLDSKFLDDPEFQSLLVGCLESLQRGETIDRHALAKDFPGFSEEIGRFLDDRQLLEEAASDFGDVPPSRVAISAYENTMDSNAGPADFSIGEAIRYIGEYEVLEEIARGGMGVVFKARQQKLNRIVALKMILAGRLADKSDVERFYREARAAGKLQHTNIVPVHEIGEHDGRHYFTMDFVDGPSLADTLREESLSPEATARLVRETAAAVQYAHEQGTVHRDLKPANILLGENGQPMVTDFGLAKMLGGVDDETRAELTASGQILGTPSYMSPEQAAGNQDLVGPESDVYSLGAILYACLTGRAPFVADSPVDTLLQVMNKEPVSLRELNPAVPKDLETICLKCLTKEPHKRYGTAQELADDLQRFIEGRPVSARPVGQISKSIRWCRRNPIVASLLTLVFVSMVAGTAISTFYANTAQKHAANEAEQRQHAEDARDEAERERDAADRARALAQQRGSELRRQLYVAQMPRALREWSDGNTAGVEQLLGQHLPEGDEDDLRGFEWYWLDNLTKSSRLTIETGRTFLDADISPDGKSIAILCNARLMIHRLDTGALIHEFETPYSMRGGVEFDPTGRFVAAGQDLVQLWSIDDEALVWEGESEPHTVWVGFTPDGQQVLSANVVEEKNRVSSATIRIRDRETGTVVHSISVPEKIYAAAISPSGDQLAASCADNMIRVWDLRTGVSLRKWSIGGVGGDLSYSPDGRWLTVVTSDGTVARHDPQVGKLMQSWQVSSNDIYGVATDGAGKHFATAGRQQIARLFDFKDGEPVREFRGHEAEIRSVLFRPGFQELVTCDRTGKIHVWDTRQNQGVERFEGDSIDISDAAFSPDMKWLATSQGISWDTERQGAVRLYSLADGATGPALDGHESGVFGVAIANGHVYSAGHDGKLITWDLETFDPIRTRSFEKPLTCLAVAESGKTLAVGNSEGEVRILNDKGQEVATIPMNPPNFSIRDVAISPDGRFVASSNTQLLQVWDCSQNQAVLQMKQKKAGPVQFSHSGRWLAAAFDGALHIYDTSTWKVIHELQSHTQSIRGVAFHPNDQRLVTQSTDSTIKLWETETWQSVMAFPFAYRNKNDRFAPIFSPDGNYLLVGRDRDEAHLLCTFTRVREPSPDPESLQARAKTLALRQLWDEAFQEYERLIETGAPDLTWAFVHAAEVAALAEQTEATRLLIIDSAKRAKEYEESNLSLAARLILAAQLRPDTDPNPEQSLRIARRAWQEKEKLTGLSLLYTLFRQGRDDEIVEFRKQNDGIGRASVTHQFLHAGALYRLGEVHEASEILKRAADRYARDMPPLGRGRYIEREGFSDIIWDLLIWREVSEIALQALNEAIDANPEDAALLAHRGDLHRRWHRWSDAMNDLGRALELNPDDVDVFEAATTSAILAGEYEIAAQVAELLLDRFQQPDRIESIWLAARIAALVPGDAGIDQSLLEQIRASAAARPKNNWRQIALVGVLHRIGHLDEAIEELDRIDAIFPDLKGLNKASLFFRRGLILYDQGKADEAEEVFRVGNAIAKSFEQPPGVFPTQGRHVWVDFLALRQELKELLNLSEHNEKSVENEREK